jgi:hypothetical protein
MKKARLYTLLICAVCLVPEAAANEMNQGFNSVFKLPADDATPVSNSSPLGNASWLQTTPSLNSVGQPVQPYLASNFDTPAFTPDTSSVKLSTNNTSVNLGTTSASFGDLGNLPGASAYPASAILDPPAVPDLSAILTGSYYLPPIYPFIVPDNYYSPTANYYYPTDNPWGTLDAEAPEPSGLSLGLLGCACLAALTAWRRKRTSA